MVEFCGIRINLKEVIREVPSLGGFFDSKNTLHARELLQCVGGSLCGFLGGGVLPRGNQAGGRAATPTANFPGRALREEEEELQQERLHIQEMRRASDGMQAEWDRQRHEGVVMGVVVAMKMVPVATCRSIVENNRPLAVIGMTMSSMVGAFLRFDLVKYSLRSSLDKRTR